jgi:hypothetical protein
MLREQWPAEPIIENPASPGISLHEHALSPIARVREDGHAIPLGKWLATRRTQFEHNK